MVLFIAEREMQIEGQIMTDRNGEKCKEEETRKCEKEIMATSDVLTATLLQKGLSLFSPASFSL